jgi:hypothetical protein
MGSLGTLKIILPNGKEETKTVLPRAAVARSVTRVLTKQEKSPCNFYLKEMQSQVWVFVPVILTLRRLRREGQKFEVSLAYRVTPCLKEEEGGRGKKKRERGKEGMKGKKEKKLRNLNFSYLQGV